MCCDFKCKYREPDGLCHHEPSEHEGYGCLGQECYFYSDCEKCNDYECLNKADERSDEEDNE